MRLEFLLEEKSMAEVLNIILPKLIPNNIKWNLHPHSGKSDLKKSIPRKIKVFRHYPEIYVIITRGYAGPTLYRNESKNRCYKRTYAKLSK